MKIEVLTLFPEAFPGPLGESITGRAVESGLVTVSAVNLRDFAHDARGTVDDKPYGGGPGMLMKVEVLFEAVEALRRPETAVIFPTPRGRKFTQALAREWSTREHLLFVCGHYEGMDQRVYDRLADYEVSIGDYVLTSGVLPAMVMADAVIRLLPGALGSGESSEQESFSESLLEYPQYTRPPEFRGLKVPEVLLSGDHGRIERWRRAESERLTRERRPDCWREYLRDRNKKSGGRQR